MKPQVLVVGAGPVGLTMAAELARYGVAVRIVEKAAQRTDKSKALVLWSRTLELLDRAGCSEGFVAAGRKVLAANIIAGSKPIAHIDITTVKSPYAYALMLPQSDTERLLEEHLQRNGVAVEREVEVSGFSSDERGITSILRHADGSDETLETEWLIGCDGAHSTVRHTLQLAFDGDTLPSDWILADVHVAGYAFPETELATYWHEEGVLVFFPIAPGRFRVIADLGRSEGAHPADPTLDQVQAVIDQRGPGGVTVSNPIWLAGFRINERKVADYRSGRVFVAGDAAHVHSPAGGQGMNTGMQDAFNLAWKLAMVCRGTAPVSLLDSYSPERSAVGDQVLKAAGRLTAVAVMRNHAAQTVRNLIGRVVLGLSPVRNAMVDTMTEVSIGYDASPLNGADAHAVDGPSPGERMPPVAGQAPIGSGDAPRFVLFATQGDATARLLERFAGLLDPDIRPSPHPQATWLVRPDGYVACVEKSRDLHAIADYLDGLSPQTAHDRVQGNDVAKAG
jgi:2-polyprenyl-6-methoxyphenol hydroxylase-like FAD-dependent oxidoreductase